MKGWSTALRIFSDSKALEELVQNLIRVGEVTSIDPGAYKARVRFEDQEDTESYDLLILATNAGKKKRYVMPDVGDNVLCIFLPSGVETGFIIGSYYPEDVARPASAEGLDVIEYEDGARIEYDLESGTLKASGMARVEVSDAEELAIEIGGSKIEVDGSQILIESNGSALELTSSGAKLSGAKVDLN